MLARAHHLPILLAILLAIFGAAAADAQIHVVPSEPVRDAVVYDERTEFADLREMLEAVRAEAGVPAIAAAVVRSDGIHAMGAAGVRSVDAPEAVTLDDPFHLGAISTTITATLAARMVEAGRIAFDTPLLRARAMLRDEIDPGWSRVTLGHLLSHRSGLPDDREPDALAQRLRSIGGIPWRQRLAIGEAIFADPPAVQINSRFALSNRGTVAAAAMLEGVSAQNWEDLVQVGFADRLGLSSLGFGLPGAESVPASGVVPPHPRDTRAPDAALAATVPWGHRVMIQRPLQADAHRVYQSVEPHASEDAPAWRRPADGVHLSIQDTARYAAFHLRGARGVQTRQTLLSPDMFRVLHADPLGQGHAMGWWVRNQVIRAEEFPVTLLVAEGHTDLFSSVIWLVPERDIAVVVLINAGGDQALTAARMLAARLLDVPE